jgi:predicted homoserine dehydrogenase-like protein
MPANPTRVAVIGAGKFGASVIEQAKLVPSLHVSAVVDVDFDAAKRLLPDGFVTTDFTQLLDQPIDIIVEATGDAESAARHSRDAIDAGKHVAMVSKEADAAVGPILHRRAKAKGVAYVPVDGDQHGQLIRLVNWGRAIGLEILAAGKALDNELVVWPNESVSHKNRQLAIEQRAMAHFAPMSRPVHGTIGERARLLGESAGAKPWDLTELTIAANATGLLPETPATFCPPLWTTEIPSVLCPRGMGGILTGRGVLDAVQVLRQPHEAGLGGGVFLVVAAQHESMRRIITGKACVAHPDGHTALITHPYHLLGIEAIGTLLEIAAGRAIEMDYRPRVDAVYVAKRDLKPGTVISNDHSPDVTAQILPAQALGPDAPVPSGLLHGARLVCDVPNGATLTGRMIERPRDSVLWSLRDEQDRVYKAATSGR